MWVSEVGMSKDNHHTHTHTHIFKHTVHTSPSIVTRIEKKDPNTDKEVGRFNKKKQSVYDVLITIVWLSKNPKCD